jgi:hypothetical protein
MDYYNEIFNTPKPEIPIEREFRAIKNPKGWWVYSNEPCYAEIGSRLQCKEDKAIKVTADYENLAELRKDKRFELITERFISDELVIGSCPVDIEHNRPFIGLDWVDQKHHECVVFLRHI